MVLFGRAIGVLASIFHHAYRAEYRSEIIRKMRREINIWGLSCMLLCLGLIASNFTVNQPQWTFTVCLALALVIPEWGDNISIFKSEEIFSPFMSRLLPVLGRVMLQGYCTVLILNRILGSVLFGRLDMGFWSSILNAAMLFLSSFVIPGLTVLFLKKLLWDEIED